MENIYNKHAELAAEIFDEKQIDIYKDYMDKNQRKRPRYNDALLEQIKTELNLDENQFLTVNLPTMLLKQNSKTLTTLSWQQ